MNIRKRIARIANNRGDMMIAWLIDNWYKVFEGVYMIIACLYYHLDVTSMVIA